MELRLSDFQRRVLVIPEDYDLFLGGGRGGSKSYTLALLALRHIEQYGSNARVLYLRKTYKGLADFELVTRDLFGAVYGTSARYNAQEHVWKFHGGAYMELGQLESPAEYAKYQGRSFSLLLIDEAGQYSSPDLLDRLRSNLRAAKRIPLRMAQAANPGDVGHHWLVQRYAMRRPWLPYLESKSGREWVTAPSTFLDNPFIDADSYKQQLESSCPSDPELLRAWLSGDWAIARGAFFAGVLDEKRNLIEPWPHLPGLSINSSSSLARGTQSANGWEFYLSHDYGSSAPSVTYVCAKSPGAKYKGLWYPRGSIVLVDELATNRPDDLGRGNNWTVDILADAIKELASKWSIKPAGVADDACFSRHGHSSGSIADEFRHYGVSFIEAKKADRRTGWERVRRMMQNAGQPDQPGLFISRDCSYFWQTVPFLARDNKRPDDVDSSGPDHAADACRYGLLRRKAELVAKNLLGV